VAAALCSSQEVSVLLADLRGFTAMAETYPTHVVVEILNRFLTRMSEIALRNGGTIDKFMGDAVMVLFGAPQGDPLDARHAVICAVEMQIAMGEINRYHEALRLPPIYMGVGINTGHVMAGMLGSALHSEYTVIGNEVNLASRIEAFSLRGQVLISASTYDCCAGFVATSEPIEVHVKGKSQPVFLREVLAIPELGMELPRQEVRKSPRVAAHIPFGYQLVIDKRVIPHEHRGVVLDVSYAGIFAEVEPGLANHQDILLKLDLSWIDGHRQDIYAKVCTLRTDANRLFAGIEFTAISPEYEKDIRHFVQLMIQGSVQK
jgi:adenylate cyclase